MLLEDDLRRLMADLESDRVERTVSTNKTDKLCRAICAVRDAYRDFELLAWTIARRSGVAQ